MTQTSEQHIPISMLRAFATGQSQLSERSELHIDACKECARLLASYETIQGNAAYTKDVRQQIWQLFEALQGEIAREVRVMLGEEAYDQKIFDQVQRDRRIAAMQQCAAENTSDVERHDSWMKMHQEGGWVYGEKFDPVAKTHPNMLPWDKLPASTRSKANIFALVAKAALQTEQAIVPPR